METPVALRLLGVAFFVAMNAFFVAAEFAVVSARPTRLRQLEREGHGAARAALRLHDRIDRVLSATQLGITLASLALGWIGEPAIAQLLYPAFEPFTPPAQAAIAHTVAIGIAFLIITALHLVLGEVVPKNVALSRSGELAMMLAPPMELFMTVTGPFLRVMDASAAAISRLFGAHPAGHSQPHSPEELKMLVTAGIKGGLLPEDVESMVHNVFDLHKTLVREVMVPRPDIISVCVDTSIENFVQELVQHRHSRIPVWDGSPENFIGVVYSRDVFRVLLERQAGQQAGRPVRPVRLRTLVRKILIVPETKPLGQLLSEFRKRRQHVALAVDEFGSIAGLVTIVDVMGRIVGSLEETAPGREPEPVEGLRTLLEGSTHVRDLEERLGIQMPRDRGFETVAGFIMAQIGRIPRTGDSLLFDGWRFTVEEMELHRVASVRLEKQ